MQENIYNEIDKLFGEYESFVITLKGDWGTGKTYFWNKYKSEKLTEKQYAYVSLFGKDNIDEIKRDIILQISVKDKHLSSIKEKIKDVKTSLGFKEDDSSFGLTGSMLSSAMSLFEKKDFEDVVICIDDFERKSSKLDIKDILGYLSVLKEQFSCQIVLILNEEKISEDQAVYKEYKEKIVDFEFNFQPSVDEAFEVIKPDMEMFKSEFLVYCQSVGLSNIRVMKKVVRFLNKISKEINFNNYAEPTKIDFLNKALSVLVPYYKFSCTDIKSLQEYAYNRRFEEEDKKVKLNQDYEDVLSYMTQQGVLYHIDEMDLVILEYINNSILDIETLKQAVISLDGKQDEALIENQLHYLQNEMLYNLNLDKDKYIKKVYDFLDKNYSVVFRKTSFSNFLFYINELKELDNQHVQKYTNLLEECAKSFVDEVLTIEDDSYMQIEDIYGVHIFKSFEKEIPVIESYIGQKLSERKKIHCNFDKLQEVLEKIKADRGYSTFEEDVINNLSTTFYKEALYKPEILEKIIYLLRHYSNSENLKIGISKIKEAIALVEADEKTNSYQIKRIKFIAGFKEEVNNELTN